MASRVGEVPALRGEGVSALMLSGAIRRGVEGELAGVQPLPQ